MNSVSMPSRRSSRARAASRSSSDTDDLLPALDLALRAHADGLEQPRRPRGAAVRRGLGEAQPLAPEGVEQQQEQRTPVAVSARPMGDRKRRHDADALVARGAALAQDDP